MNRIDHLFQTKKKNILSVFFTAGFPALDDTRTIIVELQKQGLDMLEIGIPFSDPMADGPTIQHSSDVALSNGMSLRLLFSQLQGIRTEVSIPLVLMGYLNPIMQYGFEKFCQDCQRVGIDGVIIPDLPFIDYQKEYKAIAELYGIHIVMLVTPETSEARIRLIDEQTSGFIYLVSSASTTGAQQSFDKDRQAYFQRIQAMGLKNPYVIGFGISNKSTLESAQRNSNGAIIGSRFIQLLESEPSIPQAVAALKKALES